MSYPVLLLFLFLKIRLGTTINRCKSIRGSGSRFFFVGSEVWCSKKVQYQPKAGRYFGAKLKLSNFCNIWSNPSIIVSNCLFVKQTCRRNDVRTRQIRDTPLEKTSTMSEYACSCCIIANTAAKFKAKHKNKYIKEREQLW